MAAVEEEEEAAHSPLLSPAPSNCQPLTLEEGVWGGTPTVGLIDVVAVMVEDMVEDMVVEGGDVVTVAVEGAAVSVARERGVGRGSRQKIR